MSGYQIHCPKCGQKRGIQEEKCPACESREVIGQMEAAFAELEAATLDFTKLFNREFAEVGTK